MFPRSWLLLGCTSLVSFAASFLLFAVEPMFAKRLLPELGGSPSVWTTLLMCYQILLVAGYAYSHLTARLSPRWQALLHALLLLLAALVSRLGREGSWQSGALPPLAWLLWTALLSIGPVFLVLSGTAPIVQRLASLGVRNPYVLYSASNLGSMLALLAYPALLERLLPLSEQMALWKGLVLALGLLLLFSALVAPRGQRGGGKVPEEGLEEGEEGEEGPSRSRVGRWVFLSLVPSSLTIGLTTYVTTDIASFPFLWTLPLAVYLLTFVLVFSTRTLLPRAWLLGALPWLLGASALLVVVKLRMFFLFPLHLATLFVVAMVAHGELAQSRPPVRYLTRFYLWMSVGGALGGVFNTLVAPLLLSSGMEYIVGLFLAAFVLPASCRGSRPRMTLRLAIALIGGAILPLLVLLVPGVAENLALRGMLVGMATAAVFLWARERKEPWVDGVLLTLLLASLAGEMLPGETLLRGRTFFGSFRVTERAGVRFFSHGTTLHGLQRTEPAHLLEPLSYYSPQGPFGDIMHSLLASPGRHRVALGGLGTGTMLCYGPERISWSIFEIDPMVVSISRDRGLFRFVELCAPEARIEVRDVRLALEEERGTYDLIILDAFSSDAIPVHLLTQQALDIYLARLAPGGMLAFHISNRHLDLEPVLASLARSRGLVSLDAEGPSAEEAPPLITPSEWVVMGRSEESLAPLLRSPGWRRTRGGEGSRPWTDDYSNVLSILR